MTPRNATRRPHLSAPKPESGYDAAIPLDILRSQIVEETPTAPHHHEQSSPAVMILLMGLQMLGEVVDPLGEQRNLDLGRSRVRGVRAVLADNRCGISHEEDQGILLWSSKSVTTPGPGANMRSEKLAYELGLDRASDEAGQAGCGLGPWQITSPGSQFGDHTLRHLAVVQHCIMGLGDPTWQRKGVSEQLPPDRWPIIRGVVHP